jgi:hypothetical protein
MVWRTSHSKLQSMCKARRYLIASELFFMDEYPSERLRRDKHIIFCTSVKGEEPPANMTRFGRRYFSRSFEIPDIHFTVFGCGDSSYRLFNHRKKLFKRLVQLKLDPLLNRGDGTISIRWGLMGFRTMAFLAIPQCLYSTCLFLRNLNLLDLFQILDLMWSFQWPNSYLLLLLLLLFRT